LEEALMPFFGRSGSGDSICGFVTLFDPPWICWTVPFNALTDPAGT